MPGNGCYIVLSNPTGRSTRLGPFDSLELDGAVLKSGDRVLGYHRGHHWEIEGEGNFVRLECPHEVCIMFQSRMDDESRPFGPFAAFSSTDGVLFVAHEVFAVYDNQHDDWYSLKLQTHWRRIEITPGDQGAAPPG